MVDFVRNYSGNEILRWLKDFANAVDKKEYPRIDYSAWKEIKKFSNQNKVTVGINVNPTDSNKYEIVFSADCVNDLMLTDDNYFARFLIEKGIIPEEGIMAKYTNTLNDTLSDMAKGLGICTPVYDSDGNLIWNNTVTTTINTNPYTYTTGVSTVTDNFDELKSEVNKLKTTVESFGKTIKKETNNEMATTSNVFNFDFGPLKGTGIRMSMYGFAIPNEAGKYVAYDADNDRIMDVQILNFNCDGIFYKVPKALSKVHECDVVFHNGVPVFVEDVLDESRLLVIDPKDGTEKTIMPARSPFGFDYVTTLVSLMDGFCDGADPDEDNPFGKMLPFLFLGNTNNSNDLLPLMFMANGEMDFSNPLMLLAMGGGGNFDTSNPLVLMALMKSFNK